MSMFGKGMREYNGDPDIFNNLHEDLRKHAQEKKSKKKSKKHPEYLISSEDKQKISELLSQKASCIEDISPKIQRRVRTHINKNRSDKNQIDYEDIKPSSSYYNPHYAELLIKEHNASIDQRIHALLKKSLYPHEFEKTKYYSREHLHKKISTIITQPEIKKQIFDTLDIDPRHDNLQKKATQQQIVATFSTNKLIDKIIGTFRDKKL